MWTCAYCGEANPTGAGRCEVCGQPPAAAWSAPGPAAHHAGDETTEPAPPPPPPPEPVEPGRRRRPVAMIAAIALLAAAMLAGVLLVPKLWRSDPDREAGDQAPPPAAGTATTEPEPAGTTPTESPAPELTGPAAVGLVTIDPAVTDSRATAIATMFDTYFSGINDKNYAAVAPVLDPAGVIDPSDPAQMADFEEGTSTTQNSEVTLLRIGDGADGTLAEVTFRSNQDPGAGPRGRTDETCTRWRIDYTLTGTDGDYRILRGTATSQPC